MVTEKNGWTIWSVSGRLDRLTSVKVGEEADKVFATAEKFAVEMSGLEYLSSAGIRILLSLTKKAKAEGKDFALVGAAGMVKLPVHTPSVIVRSSSGRRAVAPFIVKA